MTGVAVIDQDRPNFPLEEIDRLAARRGVCANLHMDQENHDKSENKSAGWHVQPSCAARKAGGRMAGVVVPIIVPQRKLNVNDSSLR